MLSAHALRFGGLAALALGSIVAVIAMKLASGPGQHPRDVVLIVVDTLRADYLGATGRATARTPNIDRLIASGTYFANALTPMPRTTPAVASLLTGLWPMRHGCREVGDPVLAGTLLAEVMRGRGYATAAVSANQAASPDQKVERGFDRFVDRKQIRKVYAGHFYEDASAAPPTAIGSAQATTEQALALVAAVPPEKPLFLWTLYFDPHLLYRPPSPWQDQVDAPRCWELYKRYVQRYPHLAWQAMGDFEGIASRAVTDCQKLYDAEIAYVDDEIGKLLAGLERAGRLNDAIIVFTADHGENFGEGGVYFEHGDNARDAGLRVPLAIAGSGIAARRVVQASVSLVDVMPTLLALLGMPSSEQPAVDGINLAPLLREAGADSVAAGERVVFAESAIPFRNQSYRTLLTGHRATRVCINGPRYTLCDIEKGKRIPPILYDHLADPGLENDLAAEHPDEVRALLGARQHWNLDNARERAAATARFKLVQFPRLEGGWAAQLYDRRADPDEARDVSADHPETARRLLAALEQWTRDIPEKAPAPLDPAVEEAMRQLGYLP